MQAHPVHPVLVPLHLVFDEVTFVLLLLELVIELTLLHPLHLQSGLLQPLHGA